MSKRWFGWAGKILEVDLSSKTIIKRDLPENLAYGFLGQAGINARILYDLAGRGMNPLDPAAPLIFGVGPLGGTMAPCSGRFTVTFKSPLTGIFGDSNCGGHWGPELKMAGYDHIVITGRAEHPVYLWIDDDRAEIRDARHIWGKNTWETDAAIKQETADNTIQVACIGPAGENLVRYAAIICNLARAAARCGPGAVMGSKNLKAVAVRGNRGVEVARPAEFREAVETAVEAIKKDPLYEVASTFGTTAITGLAQMLGFLPTRNFQQSTFEGAEKLRGEVMLEKYVTGHKGCYNCPVSCSRYCRVDHGPYAGTMGEGPEYESTAAFGSKCGNDNLEAVLHANMICNQLGLDTISTGNTIAWAMECSEKQILTPAILDGVRLHWGDHRAMIELVRKIAFREGAGDVLAEGAPKASRKLGGSDLVVQSKGMDYPAVDVRGTKGMALSFAVSPRGGDHLKGLPMYEVAPDIYARDIREQIGIETTPDYWLRYETKARLMYWHENWHCVVDSLGICKLEGIALKPLLPAHFRMLLASATGWDISVEDLERIGERIWNLERMFGVREGIRREDDMPPPRLLNDPITTGPARGHGIRREKFVRILEEYYLLRGWDPETGIPSEAKLRELGLEAAEETK
ncbi:MAG: aldehyde ferredoxin oxidoreductase family protein [Peptococcaceae bacterium]|nr:aldehyde ferredoxin oxidoreductase family protein [Peptococcaceae bacterium]